MSGLRPGWKRVKFGDITHCVNDRVDDPKSAGVDRYVGLEHLDPESLAIRRWGAPDEVQSTKLRFKPGDIIFGKRRAYQRKLAVADFEGICSAHAMVLRAKPDAVVPEFLPFFMQSDLFMERAIAISVGSLSPTINWKTLAVQEFALPPLEEQRRLTRILSAVNDVEQALRGVQYSATHITRRLLESFDLRAFPSFPVAALLTDGPRNGVSPQCNDQQRGRPTLPLGCVYSGVVNTSSDLKYADVDEDTFERFRLRKDDVLVVRGNGNRELVGRAGIVLEELSDCFFPDLLIRLRFDPAKLLPALAVHLWNCVPIHAELVQRAKSTNGIYKVNGADIRAQQLPLPPLTIQSAMMDSVRSHARGLHNIVERVATARRVKSQVLKSLNGEIS